MNWLCVSPLPQLIHSFALRLLCASASRWSRDDWGLLARWLFRAFPLRFKRRAWWLGIARGLATSVSQWPGASRDHNSSASIATTIDRDGACYFVSRWKWGLILVSRWWLLWACYFSCWGLLLQYRDDNWSQWGLLLCIAMAIDCDGSFALWHPWLGLATDHHLHVMIFTWWFGLFGLASTRGGVAMPSLGRDAFNVFNGSW